MAIIDFNSTTDLSQFLQITDPIGGGLITLLADSIELKGSLPDHSGAGLILQQQYIYTGVPKQFTVRQKRVTTYPSTPSLGFYIRPTNASGPRWEFYGESEDFYLACCIGDGSANDGFKSPYITNINMTAGDTLGEFSEYRYILDKPNVIWYRDNTLLRDVVMPESFWTAVESGFYIEMYFSTYGANTSEIDYFSDEYTTWLNWVVQTSGTTNALYRAEGAFSKLFITDTAGNLHTSTDQGITLVNNVRNFSATPNNIKLVGSTLVVCLANGTIDKSTDGVNWDTQNIATAPILSQNAIDEDPINGVIVLVGASGSIRVSINGMSTWANRSRGTARWDSVAFGNDTWVAVGSGGAIAYSTDTIDASSWGDAISGVATDLREVKYLNGQFITVGSSGVMLTSLDGITWTPITTGYAGTLYSVSYADGLYTCACGSDGVLYSDDNKVTWTLVDEVSGSTIYYIKYLDDIQIYIMLGANGLIATASLISLYYLLKMNNDKILTWNGSDWEDTLLTPSNLATTDPSYITNFENNGFTDLSIIDNTKIQSLVSLGYTSFSVFKTEV